MKPHQLPAHYGTAEEVKSLFKSAHMEWETIPRFFKNPEEILLRAENKLFRVNREKFLELACGIKALLKVPHSNFSELGTEVEPVFFAVPAPKLELFVNWMQLGPWQRHTFDRVQLIDLFDIGSLFICMPATDWVLDELEKLNLGPAEKLGVALKLGVHRWIERAVIKKLFSRPAYSYTVQEREDMGYQAVSILSNGQLRILTERAKRAVIPPPINHSLGALECPYFGANHDKSRCAQCWDTLWILDVGKKLIHPVEPMPFGEAVAFIRSLPFEGVMPHCREMGLDSLSGSFGDMDQVVLDNIVEKMIGLLPMSAYSA